MEKKLNVAIVGGKGLVAQQMVKSLKASSLPIESLTIYGSNRPHDDWHDSDESVKVIPLSVETMKDHDLVLMSGQEQMAKDFGHHWAERGAYVIDNSAFFRMDKQVPLVIPEVNGQDLLNDSRIIACPNCTAIMIALSLKPLADRYRLEKIYLSSYQSASGAGREALQEYFSQQLNAAREPQILPSHNAVKKPLYDNILPIVDDLRANGYTREEMKIREELQKIFHQPKLEVNVTAVRVPTSVGHGASVQAVFEEKIDLDEVKKLLAECGWIKLMHDPDYPSLMEVVDTSDIAIGRLRIDLDCEYTLNFFVTEDNLIRGASYNAIKIAERLREMKLI